MAPTKTRSTATERFISYLQGCNMRVTSERVSIIEVISKHSGLFTVDELHSLMNRDAYPVSMATLYNTIELLTDSGLVRCLRLPDRQSALYRLEVGDTPHTYLVCQHCGSVKESNQKALTRFINQYEFTTFAPRSFALTVFGVCRKCMNQQNKQKKL